MAIVDFRTFDRALRHEVKSDTAHGLNSLPSTCFIRPKTTGLVSLFIQAVLIIISGITALFFFYHVGGYEYAHWNENSTILEPIKHGNFPYIIPENEMNYDQNNIKYILSDNYEDTLVSTAGRKLNYWNITETKNNNAGLSAIFSVSHVNPNKDVIENATFGIEQVPMTVIRFGETELDWLEIIRISTLVYLVICIFWTISGLLFISTIKCEVLDIAVLNTTVLTLVALFQCAHAGLITFLIYLQREMVWRTLAITMGSMVIIFCCAFLGFVCVLLNCGWIRYIDYMHSGKTCSVCSLIRQCTRKKTCANGEYNNSAGVKRQNINNDIPLHNFDAF